MRGNSSDAIGLAKVHMKEHIFLWNSFSLIVRWLNFGLSTGVSAQHQPMRTNLAGGGGEGKGKGEEREGKEEEEIITTGVATILSI